MKNKKNKITKKAGIDNPFEDMFFWFSIAAIDFSSAFLETERRTESSIKIYPQRINFRRIKNETYGNNRQ